MALSNASSIPVHAHRDRLFLGSCMSLISTAVAFAVVSAAAGGLKSEFLLTNGQLGWILGAGIWGFTISIFILGPLCDVLGMKTLMRFAFACHLVGPLMMMAANVAAPFFMLFTGALIVSMGNGTVEAACNPLVATLYPEQKTRKLNQFHVWFPGGITIGGILSWLLDQSGITAWEVKIALIMVPTVIYGYLMLAQKFPPTESHASGVSFGEMFHHTFSRPLFWLLFICMMMTASVELGPNRWVPAILESGGLHGILVLAWINGLMALLRFFAGPVVHRLAPTGVLTISAVVSGIGLLLLSYADSTVTAFLTATIFAVGVAYFWPTMIGVTSERVPKGGPLALAMMGGMGMAIVGLVTTPYMGGVIDREMTTQLNPTETERVLREVVATYPELAAQAEPALAGEINVAVAKAQEALASERDAERRFVEGPMVANALREAIRTGGDSPLVADAQRILGPAENEGGKTAFRHVVPLTAILFVIFGLLYVSDRARGGYKVERLNVESTNETA